MDFFERQHKARKKTHLLVFFFALAVIAIIAALNTGIFLALRYGGAYPGTLGDWLAVGAWPYISAVTLFVIAAVSIVRILMLRGGGHTVAEMVKARLVNRDTADDSERRLLNVVDEMSIASGMPVPEVYVMDGEPGINAFVAGYEPGDAVLVVTSGLLANLGRDEVQGVVGHEFSHIFNGDMRLNVKLIGVLAGILVIGQLGEGLLRSLRHVRFRGKGGGQAAMLMLAAGLALFVIGYVGLFFGRIIKAAISRQREYLADASSVQYTRNPRGLASALLKIMESERGSWLDSGSAEEVSHLCFVESLGVVMGAILSTHPPLDKRIEAIDPMLLREPEEGQRPAPAEELPAAPGQPAAAPEPVLAMPTLPGMGFTAASVAATVGMPRQAHADYAADVLSAIPAPVKNAVRSARGAKGVVYILLLPLDPPGIRAGLQVIQEREGADLANMAIDYREGIQSLGPMVRLPLVDLAMPALKGLAEGERERFMDTVERLITTDGSTTVFEYALHTILKNVLDTSVRPGRGGRVGSVNALGAEAASLVYAIARAGSQGPGWEAAYGRAMGRLRLSVPASGGEVSLAGVDIALAKLDALAMSPKRALIEACAECVIHDGRIVPEEAELLRAVSESLGCPMPPLVGAARAGA